MKEKKKWSKIKVIDLFCGIGGLSHGLINEGFEVIAGIDFDASCKFAFEQNNHANFFGMDINNVSGSMLKKIYGKENSLKILVGCAPCQPFSLMNNKKSKYFNNENVELRSPIRKYADLINEIKPDIISMENVAGLIDETKYPSFSYFINVLKENKYHIFYKIVDCTKYGIPQTRRRLVLLASRLGPIQLIPETHKEPVTVRQIIGNLEKIKAGEKSSKDSLHQARNLNELNLKRIKAIPKNGGSLLDVEDISLIPLCHIKKSGKSYMGNVYARMSRDKPAPTMTTLCTGLGNGRFGHPNQDRAISLREAALIQTFPNDYIFFNDDYNPGITKISKQIGNAVPVKLGEVIAKSIKEHLKGL